MADREAAVGRSAQHTVHVLPHTPSGIARVLEPALDRLTPDADATQLLVITPDSDTTIAVADIARSLAEATPIVPITAAGRGARLLGSRVFPAIAATPGTIVALMRTSAIKLEGVRTVVIAWADELFAQREGEPLEVVLAEIPKEARRIVVADRISPDVEAFVERHLRRASRQGAPDEVPTETTLPIRFVTTVPSARPNALRRLLDDLDPPSAIVIATDGSAVNEARTAVASLGYHDDSIVRVQTTAPEERAALIVFYDLPASASDVGAVAATGSTQVVALVTPRQVPALRRLTTGAVEPLDVSRAAVKARGRDERIRSVLRAELQAGFPGREVMVLEPLLAEFDGVEIAAAALRIIERERAEERVRRVEAEHPVERAAERPAEGVADRGVERGPDRPAPRAERPERSERDERGERAERTDRAGGERRPTRGSGDYTRIFLSVGERDGVRPGDLVGAITGEAGITSDRIGKLELRDGHTVAEIASADAATVIEKMNGVSIKGRRVNARVDDRPAPRSRDGDRDRKRDAGPRRSGPRDAAGRGAFRGSSRSGPRDGARGGFGDRPRDRGPRAPGRDRDAGGDRRPPRRDDDRPRGRGGFTDRSNEGRVPRATREREEWSERADAVRNARRPRRGEG